MPMLLTPLPLTPGPPLIDRPAAAVKRDGPPARTWPHSAQQG